MPEVLDHGFRRSLPRSQVLLLLLLLDVQDVLELQEVVLRRLGVQVVQVEVVSFEVGVMVLMVLAVHLVQLQRL